MDVKVIKGDCTHICHSQEQLARFLNAGWAQEETPAEAPKKKVAKK